MTKQSIVDFVRDAQIPQPFAELSLTPAENGRVHIQCTVTPSEALRLIALLNVAKDSTVHTPGQKVILRDVSATLLAGLPDTDQRAILAAMSQPMTFLGYGYMKAELEFVDAAGDRHMIWVEPTQIHAV